MSLLRLYSSITGLAFYALVSSVPAACQTLQNITITVPEGTNNHGDEHLLCTPSTWTNIAAFFLANYVAHAATVKSIPGESTISTLTHAFLALLFPFSGVMRGLRAIFQHATTYEDPLEAALNAEALCMVVRKPKWKPQIGDDIHKAKRVNHDGVGSEGPSDARTQIDMEEGGDTIEMQHRLSLPAVKIDIEISGRLNCFMPATSLWSSGRKVHGICNLPPGYELAILPLGTRVMDLNGKEIPPETGDELLH
jgi:hypothetical protein